MCTPDFYPKSTIVALEEDNLLFYFTKLGTMNAFKAFNKAKAHLRIV